MGRDCGQRTSILSTDGVPIPIRILFWYVIIIICMNKRIEELALQCGAWHQVYNQKRFMVDHKFDVEQFAELIVRECAGKVDWILADGGQTQGDLIKKHFGVE